MLIDFHHIILLVMINQIRFSIDMLCLHIILKFNSLNNTFNITADYKNWLFMTFLIIAKSLKLYSHLRLVFEKMNRNNSIIIICYKHIVFEFIIINWFDKINQIDINKFIFLNCLRCLVKRLVLDKCMTASVMIIALLFRDNIYRAMTAYSLALLFMNNTHKATATHSLKNFRVMIIHLMIIKLLLC